MVHILREGNVTVDKLTNFTGHNHVDLTVFYILNVLVDSLEIVYPRWKDID